MRSLLSGRIKVCIPLLLLSPLSLLSPFSSLSSLLPLSCLGNKLLEKGGKERGGKEQPGFVTAGGGGIFPKQVLSLFAQENFSRLPTSGVVHLLLLRIFSGGNCLGTGGVVCPPLPPPRMMSNLGKSQKFSRIFHHLLLSATVYGLTVLKGPPLALPNLTLSVSPGRPYIPHVASEAPSPRDDDTLHLAASRERAPFSLSRNDGQSLAGGGAPSQESAPRMKQGRERDQTPYPPSAPKFFPLLQVSSTAGE